MRTLTLLVLVLSCAGCRLTPPDDRYWADPEPNDSRWKAGHKMVWTDKNKVAGYIELQDCSIKDQALGDDAYLRETQRQTHRSYFVKDTEYNVIGFISETGSTYRFKPGSAEYTHVGNYTIEDGVRTLLRIGMNFEIRPSRIGD